MGLLFFLSPPLGEVGWGLHSSSFGQVQRGVCLYFVNISYFCALQFIVNQFIKRNFRSNERSRSGLRYSPQP